MSIYKILISILLILPVATQASATVFPAGRFKIPKFCKGQNCPSMSDKKQMEALGKKWLDALPKAGFQVQNTNETATYQDKTSEDGLRSITISAYGGDWPTSLYFSKPVSSALSVEEIQDRVQAFSSNGFPTPGLKHPNWSIRALPPTRRVEEGIQILSVGPGYLKFKVHTRLFSLYGSDKRKPLWWDRATPPEALFLIKKTYWVDAEITYTIKNFK